MLTLVNTKGSSVMDYTNKDVSNRGNQVWGTRETSVLSSPLLTVNLKLF